MSLPSRAFRAFVATVVVLSACSTQAPTAADLSPAYGKRVEGDRGMVSASHPDAAAAGVEILRAGGNAADAAVAIGFALSVTDISQTGLGGGGALTFYDARRGKAEHLSFYPRSGSDPAWAVADGPAAARPAGRAAGVPGMVAGLLEAQRKFGKLTRAQVMAPAIKLAREGFVLSPLLARTIASSRAKLEADSAARATFFHEGAPLGPGERLVQPQLAATLERIAKDGSSGFYEGPVAARLAQDVQARGGLITATDMARYPVAAMIPLCANWRGYTVLTAPPPMGGSAVLQMLQMAETSGLTNAGGFTDQPAAVTALAGVLRTAQADAGWWRGDPFTMAVPARGVGSASYARERAQVAAAPVRDSITRGNVWPHDQAALPATCAAYPYASAVRPIEQPEIESFAVDARAWAGSAPDENTSFTSHHAVVDADGNAVSATTTVGVLFGSGVYTGGFFLNSSAANFDARTRGTERYANSTMAPTMILDGRTVRLVIGAAGSQYIQPAIAQVTVRILAYGEDAGQAIHAPRIQTNPNRREVEVEPGFSPEVYAALVAAGYKPTSRIADIAFGGVHGVFVRRDGRRIGIADPRRDGVARKQ